MFLKDFCKTAAKVENIFEFCSIFPESASVAMLKIVTAMKRIAAFLIVGLVIGLHFGDVFSQNTECQSIAIDDNHFFFEDFSDYDLVARLPFQNGVGSLPTCWKKLLSGTGSLYSPKIVKGRATGTNNDIALYSSCLQMRVYGSQQVIYAVLPQIATALNTLEVSFSMAAAVCDSSCILSLGYLTNDSVFETADFVAVRSFRNNYLLTDSFVRHEVSLEGMDFPENARLAFRIEDQYSIYRDTRKAIFIDDILIRPIPPCQKPSDIEIVAITDTSVTLRWQPSVADVPCRVEYGPAGFPQGTGTTLVTSSNSITLHSLMESTEYEVYIQTLCGETDTSEAAHFRFLTDCLPIVVDEDHPYFEDFADSTFACWRQRDGCLNGWQADTGRLFSTVHGNGRTRRLQSPMLDMSSLYTARCVFSYRHSARNMGTKLDLYYRTSVIGPWTLLKTCTELDATDTVILPYLSDNYQISFVADKQKNEVSIFSVLIEGSDECVAPPRPRLLRAEDTAAHITWDTYYQGAAVELEYGSAGFAVGTGSRLSVADTVNSRWLSGLQPDAAYEVYVRQECAGGGWSEWSLPLSFRTYCAVITLSDSVIFTENFEGMLHGSFPDCWLRFSEGTDESCFPQVYQGAYTPDDGGTALLLTASAANADLWTVGSQSGIVLPCFSNPLSELEVSFTTAMTSTRRVHLEIGYLDENEDFVKIEEIPTNHYYSQDRSVLHRIRFCDSDIPETLQGRVAFRWLSDSGRTYACLDDIRVRKVLACDFPLDVRVKEVDEQSYMVTWQPQDSTQNLWEVECSGVFHPTSTNYCSLRALAAGEDYFVRVRAICGDSHSYWTDTLFFHTACKCYPVMPNVPYFDDFSDYESSYNVYDMADQPDCWSFFYYGYYQGFAPHIYNGSYALNDPALLLSVGVQGHAIGRELYALFPPYCNNLGELKVDFDLYNSRDTLLSGMELGYLTDRYDFATFRRIDTVLPHFYSIALGAHRRYVLRDYGPFPNLAVLAFKLNAYDQTTHFYSVDNVRVSLVTDSVGIAEHGSGSGTFSLYPNPADGIVTVQLSPETCTLIPEIQVFDVYGRMLQVIGMSDTRGVSLQTAEIDMSAYPPGIYFVKLVDGGDIIGVRKVVRR